MMHVDYNGPFYNGTKEQKEDRRKAVLIYLPHTFKQSTKSLSKWVCRICGFSFIDAPCVSEALRVSN